MRRAILVAVALSCCAALSAAQGMEFTVQYTGGNCNSCVWVLAEGTIDPGTTQKLKAFIAKEKPAANIRFNSPGGNVIESLELGQLFVNQTGTHSSARKGRAFLAVLTVTKPRDLLAIAPVFTPSQEEFAAPPTTSQLASINSIAPTMRRNPMIRSLCGRHGEYAAVSRVAKRICETDGRRPPIGDYRVRHYTMGANLRA